MAKYEVVAAGIYMRDENGNIKEASIGEVIDFEPNEFILSKLRKVSEKTFEVATPQSTKKK